MPQIIMSDEQIVHTLGLLETHHNVLATNIEYCLLAPWGVDIAHAVKLAEEQRLNLQSMRPFQDRVEQIKIDALPRMNRGSVVINGVQIITHTEEDK